MSLDFKTDYKLISDTNGMSKALEIHQKLSMQMEMKLFEVVEWLADYYNKHDLSKLPREERYKVVRNELSKVYTQKPYTNWERMRQMSDKELADFLAHFSRCDYCYTNCGDENADCEKSIWIWLNSEVEE